MKLDEPVTKIMADDPITVELGQKLSDVRELLSTELFHHLPVVSDGKLVGLITTTDLLQLSFSLYDSDESATFAFLDEQFKIEDVMEKHLITVDSMATIKDAAAALSSGGFHALPVVDDDGRLRGIVTSTDLINYLLEQS